MTPTPERLAAGEKELKPLLAREGEPGVDRERLRADLLELARKYRGLPPALAAAGALRRLPSPLDRLDGDKVPAALRAEIGKGDPRQAPPGLAAVLRHRTTVRAFALRPDGAVLASGDGDGLLKLWDLATGKELRSWRANAGGVRAVAFSPDGKLLASAGEDRRAVLWDAEGKLVREFTGHGGAVRGVAFSPDGLDLATCGADAKLWLWNVNSGVLRKTMRRSTGELFNLEFSPDGGSLVTARTSGVGQLWDLASGKTKPVPYGNAQGKEHALAFSPDGNLLGAANLWLTLAESSSLNVIRQLPSPAGGFKCLAFRPDGREVAGADVSGAVRFFDPETGAETATVLLRSAGNSIVQVGYTPDGRYLVVSHNDGLISLLRLAPAVK